LVSSLNYGDHASGANVADYQLALAMIEENKNIRHFNQMENDKVLDLFKECHIALLPTYDDTYGYSVLEAQASGCPVISTNGSALSEINNNKLGWVIEVPLFEDNRSVPRTAEAKEVFRTKVVDSLVTILTEAVKTPSIITKKAHLCLESIESRHSPKHVSDRLKKIYSQMLQD
jgi:glycosyltransferase involved in cell wall biosynthesis